MKKVLIITHSEDNECIDIVSRKIVEHGGEAIRFNVDDYPLHSSLSTCFENGEWKIYFDKDGVRHQLHDLEAVWFRRAHNLGGDVKDVIDKEFWGSILGEIRVTLFGFLESINCFQIGKYSVYRRLDSKEEQLKLANHLGLKIPETCITNNPEEAKRFVLDHPNGVITKMQSSFAIYQDGKENVVFTNTIGPDNLEDIESLQYCPMQFQEKINKKVELRITIVGDEVFAFAIDSQKLENSQTDWRKEGITFLNDWVPYELPGEISDKLLQMMDIYQMNYGAIDIIVTPEDDYYFLEVNSAGEFFWLDRLVDERISDQIAKVLLNKAPRRYTPVYETTTASLV